MLPPLSFLGGQDFEACRPPSGLDGLDEFFGQLFGAHFFGERVVVVFDRDEFDFNRAAVGIGGAFLIRAIRGVLKNRVSDARLAVVLGAAEHAHVHKPSPARQLALPMNARVRAHNEISFVIGAKLFEKVRGRGRFPKKLIRLARGTVAE